MDIKKIMDDISPLWGVCPFEKISENLIPCRAKSRLPENAKSVIIACFPYLLSDEYYKNRNISRYAVVADYHTVINSLIGKAVEQLKEAFPEQTFVNFTDNSPIPEVRAACLAGLGVIGMNSLFITKEYGSFVFLGEIVTTLELEPTGSDFTSCLMCGKCEKACPAGAITKCGIDREKCLSAVTQKKGELTEAQTEMIKESGCIWGCDVCQEVCPLNISAKTTDIKEFIEFANAELTAETDIEGRAYEWRGKAVVERNLKIIDSQNKTKGVKKMKLIVAIINNDDAQNVITQLTKGGFSSTKLSTSGGFLRAGNTTLLIGTEDDKVDNVIDIIKEYSSKRTQMVSPSPSFMAEGFISKAVEVTVGGATVFVLDVDKFIKL